MYGCVCTILLLGGTPPLENQPADFSRLVGRFRIQQTVTPSEVLVGDPVALKVQIRGMPSTDYKGYYPQRKSLRIFRANVKQDYFVEPLPHQDHFDGKVTWTFYYQLRPKHAKLERIPTLRLSYYDPQLKMYQRAYARSVALTVKPRPKVVTAPERMYRIASGTSVLQQNGNRDVPWLLLAGGLIGMPLLCGAGYRLWQRLFPNEQTRRRQRQSQAARYALRQLHRLKASPSVEQVTYVMTRFLRDRLGLVVEEPTSEEMARQLKKAGLATHTTRQAVTFFAMCQQFRFAPLNVPSENGLCDHAVGLVETIENEL